MGWAGRTAAIALLPLVGASALQADSITDKEGNVYEGRILERNADYVLFQSTSGGIVATRRFQWREIDSVTESPPEAAQLADEYRLRAAAAEQAATAEAMIDLGQWCHANRLYDEALSAFKQAVELDPQRESDVGLFIARAHWGANNIRTAWTQLKALGEKYPKDARIAAETARLSQHVQARVDQHVQTALAGFRKDQMRQTVLAMEALRALDLPDWQSKADEASQRLAGMPFGKLLAEARLHQPCAACGGDRQSAGLVACPTCKTSPAPGKVARTRVETITEKDPKTGVERRRSFQAEYYVLCPNCRGFGVAVCPDCRGAGVDLGSVGELEKPFVIDGLRARIDWLCDKRLAPAMDDHSTIHPINLEPTHLAACRLRYYMQQYLQLDSKLAGKELLRMADRRSRIDGLWRSTAAAYRARDVERDQQLVAERLRRMLDDEGILWGKDFEYKEPRELSGGPSAGQNR